MRILCFLGHHGWVDHPDYDVAPVRVCRSCGRCEHRAFLFGWVRAPHLEK